MAKVAVADAAPLIAFARIGQLELLPRVLGDVRVPETAAAECLMAGMPGADTLAQAFSSAVLMRCPDVGGSGAEFPQLDAGETAAIRLARQLGAVLLIGERLGRAVAGRLGLSVVGSLGVLLAAKRAGFVPSLSTLIGQIKGNGSHFSDALVPKC